MFIHLYACETPLFNYAFTQQFRQERFTQIIGITNVIRMCFPNLLREVGVGRQVVFDQQLDDDLWTSQQQNLNWSIRQR